MPGFVYLSLVHKMGTDILRETGVNLYHCEIGGRAGLSSKRHIETKLDLHRVTVSNQF